MGNFVNQTFKHTSIINYKSQAKRMKTTSRWWRIQGKFTEVFLCDLLLSWFEQLRRLRRETFNCAGRLGKHPSESCNFFFVNPRKAAVSCQSHSNLYPVLPHPFRKRLSFPSGLPSAFENKSVITTLLRERKHAEKRIICYSHESRARGNFDIV